MASSIAAVHTEHAPTARGPYSQAIKANGFIFVSGSLGIDPTTDKMVEGGTEAQARQALKNMRTVLEAAGSDFAHVVKVLAFFTNIKEDFVPVNKIYEEAFAGHKPARSAVQVAALPLGALWEVECVAVPK